MVFLVESGLCPADGCSAGICPIGAHCTALPRALSAGRDDGAWPGGRLASRSTPHFGETSAHHREAEEPGDEQPGDRAPAGCQRESHSQANLIRLYLRGDFGDAFFCSFVRPAVVAVHFTDQEQVAGARRATSATFEVNVRSIGLPPKQAGIGLRRAVVMAHPKPAARRKLRTDPKSGPPR